MILDENGVWAVAFHTDGNHLLGGSGNRIRRWQLEDGREVGEQMGMNPCAISASRDDRWIVCGTGEGASVWDAELRKQVICVEGKKLVYALDVSPDSTRFATGTEDEANVWCITTGKRLVDPLRHDSRVIGVKFSPNGKYIATASSRGSIRVVDSRTGDALVTIKAVTPSTHLITPLAWSSDSQKIFAASHENKIKSFAVPTGSLLAESPTQCGERVESIALAANDRFIAAYASCSIWFLDTSTLTQIDLAIEDTEKIWSIAISPDCSRLATGRGDGKITVRDLGQILPDLYGSLHVSICPFVMFPSALTHHVRHRHLLATNDNRTSSLQRQVTMISRYQFVLPLLEASPHDRTGRRAS